MTRIRRGWNTPAMGTEPNYSREELLYESILERVEDDDELLEELFEEAGLDVDTQIDSKEGREIIEAEAMRQYEIATDAA